MAIRVLKSRDKSSGKEECVRQEFIVGHNPSNQGKELVKMHLMQ